MKSIKTIKLVAMGMVFCLLPALPMSHVSATEIKQEYEKVINHYYELVNSGQQSEICNLYGNELNNFVADFFNNNENKESHSGIYNVYNAQVVFIKDISSNPMVYDDGIATYSNAETFLVKCNMNVFSPDKYYTEGNLHDWGGGTSCSYCGAIAK